MKREPLTVIELVEITHSVSEILEKNNLMNVEIKIILALLNDYFNYRQGQNFFMERESGT